MKHRFVRRVSALALAGCLLAGSGLPAFAASAAKEEVIYANLTASGAVTGVYAVNSFSVQAGDTVADHGSYTAVRNMTTSDAVEQSGDTVTVHVTEDGKLYYEGTMDTATALPWVVKLTYTLDGAEIRPDELGGKSGALSIRLQVGRNPDCTGSFFDDYALQVTMSLDTELARNISAPGATVANVGSKKQLSYILLPGADSDVTVTADVTDFAMEAVSLNGVRLNLNLDLGDMDLTGMLEQLHEGSSTLNGSYGAFDAGVRQLAGVLTGMLGNLSVLTDGVNQLAAQYVQLDDGLNAYTDGVAQLKAGVAQLAEGASQLTGGTGELRSSVSDIDMGAQLDGLLNSLSGGGEVQSFTSAENTEVSAVQFALQTTAITAPAPAAQPEPAAVTLTFWQKLLKLFGLYKG